MALFEVLSGKGIDLYNPDVVWQGNLTTKATHNITVTKKPRFIVWSMIRNTSTQAAYGGLYLADCELEKLRNLWFGSGGYTDDETIFANRIPTCSNTNVTVKGSDSYATHNHVAIYY